MQLRSLSASSLFLSLPLLAQAYQGEGPGIVLPAGPDQRFSTTALGNGVTSIAQLQLTPHPTLGADMFYLAATVVRSGGAGSRDAMTGVWNNATAVFTKNNDVDHMNSSGSEFQCSVSDDLLTVVLDVPTSHPIGLGTAIWASRASINVPFGTPARINGVPPGYIDPQLTRVGGKLMFMWVQSSFACGNNSALAIGEFDRMTGTVTNQRVVVSNPGPRSTGSHSPSGMFDKNGEMRALIFSCCVPGRQSNAYFNSSIHDDAPSFVLMDTGTWLNNPDSNGGSLLYAESPSYLVPRGIGILALSSARIPSSGGTLDMTAFAPTRLPTDPPYIGAVLVGLLGTGPIQLPGIDGSPLSLNPATMFALPSGGFDQRTGTLSYSMPTPPLPLNTVAHAQPAMLDPLQQKVWLGNTAWIVVR
jgi:hypothetical protein